MRNPIELQNNDLNIDVFKDILFFSFAEGGAMGEPGGVRFFVKSGELYHLNYVYGDIELSKVKECFPVLGECVFGMFGRNSKVPKDWKYVDLGMGNHLIVRKEIFALFKELLGEVEAPSEAYQKWMPTAEAVLDKLANMPQIQYKTDHAEQKVSLSANQAIRCIRAYYYDTVNDEHGRYLSWRHCYCAFRENRKRKDEKTVDYLALHLAFYLASWGMYRGSSFLLQKDYKVHKAVVNIILEDKYNPLLGITAEALLDETMLDLLDDISKRIRKAYADEQPAFPGTTNNATDTLVTKILLGTLGCVPAYDRYYVQAVRQYGVSSGRYDRKSIQDIAKFYLAHSNEFERVRKELSESGIEYPAMKIMDMCMWQLSYEADQGA